MPSSLAYRVLFVIPSALPVIPSAVEESLHHRPEGRALRPFIWEHDGAGSSSAGTQSTVKANLVIGAAESDGYIQTQKPIKVKIGEEENTLYSNKNHIAGDNYPMYGKTSVKGDENPRIKMKHLSALVALKIVNQGDGIADNGDSSIEINNVEFVAPEEVVGNFNVTVSQTPIKYDKVAASATAIVNLADANGKGITINPRDEALVYFAVKPFTAKKDAKITIKINGSPRTVQMPNDIKFEAGKVTTLRVPVKLNRSKSSNAVTTYANMFQLPDKDNNTISDLSVNGELLTAYKVPHGQNITITGTVKELVGALNAEFYASYWKNQQASMTVNLIDIEMPVYGDNADPTYVQIAYYQPFLDNMKESVRKVVNEMSGLLGWFLKMSYDELWSPGLNLSKYGLGDDVCIKTILQGMLKDGIPRDNSNGNMIYLTRFIAAETLTFEQIVENGVSNASLPIFILDESQIHKEVGAEQINSLFDEKFTGATFEELKQAVNTGECNNTIRIIYEKIQEKVGDKKVDIKIGDMEIWPIFQGIFSSPEQMAAIIGDIRVRVKIGTCSPTGAQTTYPVVIWGLNAGITN